MDRENVADLQLGQHAVDRELVVVFAQRTDDVVFVVAGRVLLAEHGDVVVRAVHRRAHEVGGAGVHAGVLLVDVFEVDYRRDQVAVGTQHESAQLRAQRRLHAAGERALVLSLDAVGNRVDVGHLVGRQIGDADAARQVDELEVRARLGVKFARGVEQNAGERGVVLVAEVVGREEGVQPEALDAQRLQLAHRFGQLSARHAVFGVLRRAHDLLVDREVLAVVEAQRHRLGHFAAGDLCEKVDVGDVVERDRRAETERQSVFFGGGLVAGEHDVVADDAALFAQHQFGQRRAVHPAAQRVQNLHDRRVGGRLDREVLFEAGAPRERVIDASCVVFDPLFVIDVEGGGVCLFDLFGLRLCDYRFFHKSII